MSPYGATEVEGERMWRARAATLHCAPDAASLRFFNVYGTRRDPEQRVRRGQSREFMSRLASGLPATIFGRRRTKRATSVHVSDAARAVIAAIDAPARLGGSVTMNVGTRTRDFDPRTRGDHTRAVVGKARVV
jgi:nucleoside-diphosphate-sugar epimerase